MTATAPVGFRTTSPRKTAVGRGQSSHASDYTALTKEVKALGLLERRPGWYAARCAVLVVALGIGFALLVALGQTWWQLLTAVYFSIVLTQIAFLTHDAAHRQMFESGKRGEWFSRIVANMVVGLGYGWWMNKHSRHHANPNKIGKDGDIAPGAIAFVKEDAEARTGIKRWLTAKQGYYFFPILMLSGLDLHVMSAKAVLGAEPVKHRAVEASLLAIRLIGFPVLVISLLGPVIGSVFLVVQVFAFGLYMGGSFAPNHKGMALIPADQNIDYLRRQVLTSRNISGFGMPTIMGGLNYQIEHHLFPNMPSVNLKKVRPIVIEHCRRLDIPYVETSLVQSYAIVVRYLHKVGIGAADPFDCPPAAAMRATGISLR